MTLKLNNAPLLLAEARAYVRANASYYSHVLYNLVPIWDDRISTLGVSHQLVCVINPAFWCGLPNVIQRASCLVHEANHILRGMDRIRTLCNIDEDISNIAADIPINDSMLDCRTARGTPLWELPDFVCLSKKYGFPKGLTMEQYFDLLLQIAKKSGKTRNEKGEIIIGDFTFANKIAGGGGCGSITGRGTTAVEDSLNAKHGRSPSEVFRVRRQGIRDLQKAGKTAAGRGNLPRDLLELLNWDEDQEEAVIPWPTYLNKAVRRACGKAKAGSMDYSMRRPSKRSYTRGYPVPGLITHELDICIVEDSSGSMGHPQLRTARVEICSCLQQMGIVRAHFMDADAHVSSVQYVSINQIRNLPISGRGGTDFRPAIEYAKKLRPRPKVLIYLTDGDGEAPKHAPTEFEVIFCIVPSPYQRIPAPWGTTIIMSDDNGVRRAHKWRGPPGAFNNDGDEEDDNDD